jgi:hypothetical protein
MKTLVSQNLEFLELELSDEELLSVVGGKQTEDSNPLVTASGPQGIGLTVEEPPQGQLILLNPVTNQPAAIVKPGG